MPHQNPGYLNTVFTLFQMFLKRAIASVALPAVANIRLPTGTFVPTCGLTTGIGCRKVRTRG